MEYWSSREYVVDIPDIQDEEIQLADSNFTTSKAKPSLSLIDKDTYNNLNKTKDLISGTKNWNNLVKIHNPYEKVTKISSKNEWISSRAFYKLYEILVYNEEKANDGDNIAYKRSLHLCEAPGGFIQAAIKRYPDIEWYSQSLYKRNNEDNGALDIDKNLDPNKWIGYKTGSTGNLYDPTVVANLCTYGKFDLITGDGGIETSEDPNNQEQLHQHLIFSQIYTALKLQNLGGTLVLKIFDIFTTPTLQLIVILKLVYSSVYIIKPRTSRFSNAEKYIVCNGFMGAEDIITELEQIHTRWYKEPKMFCRDFGIEIPKNITGCIKNYNKIIVENQLKYINKCLGSSNKPLTASQINAIEAEQNRIANLFLVLFGLSTENSLSEVMQFGCKHGGNDENDGVKKCLQCNVLYV